MPTADLPPPAARQAAAPLPAPAAPVALLVDDEALIRLGLAAALEAAGWTVLTAGSADEADRVAGAAERGPDVVVADLHLGRGPDGLETVRRLRARHGDVPAVLLTGDDCPEVGAAARAAGCLLLCKPVAPRELRRAIEGMVPGAGA